MKFRGKMTGLAHIRQFAQLLHILAKSSKTLVVRLTSDKFILIESEKDVGTQAATAWCEFTKDYFVEYLMEGLSPVDPEIFLQVRSESLASTVSTLKSNHNANMVKIKLTNKLVPCLTVEIESPTQNSTALCVHDVPISVISRRKWDEYQEPELPKFNVSATMPELRSFRQSLERLKSVNTILTISIQTGTTGKLVLSAESMSVKESTTFPDLHLYDIEDEENEGGTNLNLSTSRGRPNVPVTTFEVDVDMKSFVQLIPSESLKPNSFICSLVAGKMVHLFYILNEVTLQYCVPGVQ